MWSSGSDQFLLFCPFWKLFCKLTHQSLQCNKQVLITVGIDLLVSLEIFPFQIKATKWKTMLPTRRPIPCVHGESLCWLTDYLTDWLTYWLTYLLTWWLIYRLTWLIDLKGMVVRWFMRAWVDKQNDKLSSWRRRYEDVLTTNWNQFTLTIELVFFLSFFFSLFLFRSQ